MVLNCVAVLACLLGVLAASPAAAVVSLQPVSGKVSIDRGDGFKPVGAPVEVNPGDRVMATPGGETTLVYSETCLVSVTALEVVTVASEPPCQAPSRVGRRGYLIGGAVVAGAAGIAIAVGTAVEDGASSAPASP